MVDPRRRVDRYLDCMRQAPVSSSCMVEIERVIDMERRDQR